MLINIIIISGVLKNMFYSIKMANISPFRCPKILSGPFRWLKSFSVFSRTETTGYLSDRPAVGFIRKSSTHKYFELTSFTNVVIIFF